MILALLMAVTALLYASAGFGGGSTYNALLILDGVALQILPMVALTCNIIVVCGGVWHFHAAGYIRLRRILPWISLSVPASFAGGLLEPSEKFLTGMLGLTLCLVAVQMLLPLKKRVLHSQTPIKTGWQPPLLGAVLGFVAGLTGIGGGVFLAPALYLLGWQKEKTIAGSCALFILVNSLAGLAGHASRLEGETIRQAFAAYWFLFPAVWAGGQIGSYLGAVRIAPTLLKKITALLLLFVALRLGIRFFT